MASGPPPLIVHVIHALDVGGLENGVVNLINRTPIDRFRHAIVCMTHSSDFHRRIRWDGVEVISMHRDEAPLWQTYLRLLRLFVRLRPSIVHSRNLSGLDALLPALCAGVTVRVHGEHGRDIRDLDGSNPRYRRLRGLFRPFVSHYTTVSRDLAGYLVERVGVSPDRVSQIYNGVDTELFKPRCGQRELPFHLERSEREPVLIGTVGRLQPVKDQALLLKAFAEAMRCAPDAMRSAYLVIVGDGPMRTVIEEEVRRLNLGNRAFLLGSRDDVASILRSLDLFVLPSLAEGISNTILEAMASGLPVLATRVGGNPELIVDGEVGALFEAGDWRALARLLVGYTADMALRNCQGSAARQRAERCFSLTAMVQSYLQLYDKLLAGCSSNARSS